jgi:hypothetical protein
MVLVQILVSPANNNTFFVVPVSGKCSIRVLNMVYHSTEANTHSRVIQLRSGILQFPYSPMKWLTLVSNPQATLNFDSGFEEYSINNCVLQGQLDLFVQDYSTGAQPEGFQWCLVSLEIDKINENYQPMSNKSHPSR